MRGLPRGVESEAVRDTPDIRLDTVEWARIESDLDAEGHAVIRALIEPAACLDLARRYAVEEGSAGGIFRSRVVMVRHGFGRGEYKYFAYPLPPVVARLRERMYPPLTAIANRWAEAMGADLRFPDRHEDFLARCHASGQVRPTPLLLKYGPGDYNCLHQDLYGEHAFPLQVVILLSQPGRDFTGGEFVMTEQRPRMQSRAMVVPLLQGDAAVIPVHHRPVRGTRGIYRVNLRHGVSRVLSGERYTAGIIFHDAS